MSTFALVSSDCGAGSAGGGEEAVGWIAGVTAGTAAAAGAGAVAFRAVCLVFIVGDDEPLAAGAATALLGLTLAGLGACLVAVAFKGAGC